MQTNLDLDWPKRESRFRCVGVADARLHVAGGTARLRWIRENAHKRVTESLDDLALIAVSYFRQDAQIMRNDGACVMVAHCLVEADALRNIREEHDEVILLQHEQIVVDWLCGDAELKCNATRIDANERGSRASSSSTRRK